MEIPKGFLFAGTIRVSRGMKGNPVEIYHDFTKLSLEKIFEVDLENVFFLPAKRIDNADNGEYYNYHIYTPSIYFD